MRTAKGQLDGAVVIRGTFYNSNGTPRHGIANWAAIDRVLDWHQSERRDTARAGATTGATTDNDDNDDSDDEAAPPTRTTIKDIRIGPLLNRRQRRRLDRELKKYERIFCGGSRPDDPQVPDACRGVVASIDIIPEHDVSRIKAGYRRRSPEMNEVLERCAEDLLASGAARHSKSSVSSAPVITPKTDAAGNRTGWRVNVDFRALNKATRPDRYPMPNLHSTIADASKHSAHTTFDTFRAFHQVTLDDASIPYTATIFTRRHFLEWLRAPMGLRNMPAQLQRYMDGVTTRDNECTYIDDTHIGHGIAYMVDGRRVDGDNVPYGFDGDTAIDDLVDFLERCHEHNIQLRPDKAALCYAEIEYLGATLGPGYSLPNRRRTEALRAQPRPTTHDELGTALAAVRYYANYLPELATITAPLVDARAEHKGAPSDAVAWTAPLEQCYAAMLNALANAAANEAPTRVAEWRVRTDYSSNANTAAWSYEFSEPNDEPGTWRPYWFGSARLPGRRRAHAARGELRAAHLAIKRDGWIVRGREYVIVMDSEINVRRINTDSPVDADSDESRWIAAIAATGATAEHRRENDAMDWLSRDPTATRELDEAAAADGQRASRAAETRRRARAHATPNDDNDNDDNDDVTARTAPTTTTTTTTAADALPPPTPPTAPGDAPAADAPEPAQHATADRTAPSNRARWQRATADDDTLATWRTAATAGTPVGEWRPYWHVDGSLRADSMSDATTTGVLAVPRAAYAPILAQLHAEHASADAMWRVARGAYHWSTMRADIEATARECGPCQRTRRHRSTSQMGPPRTEATGTNEMLGVDVFTVGRQAILTITDAATRYTMAVPITTHHGGTLTTAYARLVAPHGSTPSVVVTDSEFDMHDFRAALASHGTELVPTAPHDTNARAFFERPHDDLRRALTRLDADAAWAEPTADADEVARRDALLQRAVHAINVLPSVDGSPSSYEQFHGSTPRLITDAITVAPPATPNTHDDATTTSTTAAWDRARAGARMQERALDAARAARAARRARTERNRGNRRATERPRHVGELVWLDVTTTTGVAHAEPRRGPFVVADISEHGATASLRETTSGEPLAQRVSTQRLSPYTTPTSDATAALDAAARADGLDYTTLAGVMQPRAADSAAMLPAALQRTLAQSDERQRADRQRRATADAKRDASARRALEQRRKAADARVARATDAVHAVHRAAAELATRQARLNDEVSKRDKGATQRQRQRQQRLRDEERAQRVATRARQRELDAATAARDSMSST